jgi:hypothetical protein
MYLAVVVAVTFGGALQWSDAVIEGGVLDVQSRKKKKQKPAMFFRVGAILRCSLRASFLSVA